MKEMRRVVSEALRALAEGDQTKAGDMLASALTPNEVSPIQKCLGYLKAGDIEKAMTILEELSQEDEVVEAVKPTNPDNFLYVPDRENPSTWKLPIAEDSGQVTIAQLGRAAAALGPGFRGQPVDMPPEAKRSAARKLIGHYKELNAECPPYLYEIAGMAAPTKEQIQVVESGHIVRNIEGREYEVVIIKAGTSKNGNYYPAEALKGAVNMFEGMKAYNSHVTDEELKANPSRKVDELLGWFDGVKWDEAREAITGHFHPASGWLREMMLNAYNDGKKDLVGFSIDAYVNSNKRNMEGKDVNYVESFERVNSVDVVCEPAAGGEVIRVVAGCGGTMKGDMKGDITAMTDEEKKMADEEMAAKMAAMKGKKMTKEELIEALKVATHEERLEIAEALRVAYEGDKVQEDEVEDPVVEVVNEAVKKSIFNLELREQVRESGLPKDAQEFVLGLFNDKADTPKDEIKRTIESQRALLDKTVKASIVIPSYSRPVFGVDLAAASLNRLLGVADATDKAALDKDKIGWMGIREWYTTFTGDEDYLGRVAPHRITEANVNATSANSVLKNALNKVLTKRIQSWDAKLWWKPIVDEQDATTIQDVTAIKYSSLAPLNVVAEGETYAELDFSDAEETASFVKYGAYLGITLESIMKDDLNAIKKLPNGLADAWAYTMSDRVSSVFTTAAGAGPTLTETSRALFNTTDANLGTTALSFASYDAARTAMKKLTALGNVRRIGVGPKYLLVPPDLETTAYQIRDSDKNPDNAENGVNVHKGKFEVIVVNDWTDTDNWYLLADPADIAVVQLWYFRGQRTPQLFEATDESTGALFTNDTYRYKTRFFCARAIVDFRGAYGATVT